MFQYSRASAHMMSVCAVLTVAIAATGADASLIHFASQSENSTEGLGAYEGTIEYVPDVNNSTQGLLTINLINTTHVDIGGFITGFVFNIDSTDPDATASLTSYTHPFLGVTNHPAPPFGHSFTAGAALGGNWTGGGNPNPGIEVGATGTFVTLRIVEPQLGAYDESMAMQDVSENPASIERHRPTCITVLACLMLVMVAIAAVSAPASLMILFGGNGSPFKNTPIVIAMGKSEFYRQFCIATTFVGFGTTLWAAYIGWGLLQCLEVARRNAIWFAWYSILFTICASPIQYKFLYAPMEAERNMPPGMLLGPFLLGTAAAFASYFAILYFLKRPDVIIAFAKYSPTIDDPTGVSTV
jgi:hypothetical protein